MDKEQQKKIIIEIMEADEKDGLYDSVISKMETTQTAMQTLIAWGDEMLLKYPQKILSFAEVIDKAEELLEMEKQQTEIAYETGWVNGDLKKAPRFGSDYYNETFKK